MKELCKIHTMFISGNSAKQVILGDKNDCIIILIKIVSGKAFSFWGLIEWISTCGLLSQNQYDTYRELNISKCGSVLLSDFPHFHFTRDLLKYYSGDNDLAQIDAEPAFYISNAFFWSLNSIVKYGLFDLTRCGC